MTQPAEILNQLANDGLLRSLRTLDSAPGVTITRGGRQLLNFPPNDYLGLAGHPALAAALIDGVRHYGAGATAPRLVCGSHPPHQQLEKLLAEAKQTEAALTFSSGFAVAIGAIPAIVGKGDVIMLDKLSHACLVDAARLSGATLRVFPHNDLRKLRRLLAGVRARSAGARVLVATEAVFSMDGDVCPLRELVDLTEQHDALLWLDEAHAVGVMGGQGMGLAEAEGLQGRIAFQMGTFSKALGLAGGYLAAPRGWIDLLVNRARSFIYSTAPPPALAHAVIVAVELVRSAEGLRLRQRLGENIRLFRNSLGMDEVRSTPIQAISLGSNDAALAASATLEQDGLWVPAIRYPTVPRGTARLRVSLSAAHPPAAIHRLAAALCPLSPRHPIH
ncbi:MAG: 8-amino-7-oxononanoate synthase [Akkermansiaceae bacterium]|nr:8-amino-7-oxononanoate synthase [Akkermansiaceae bacterium]